MATVHGLTTQRMLEIEAASVVGGSINELGELELYTQGAGTIKAGIVKGSDGVGVSHTLISYQASPSETVQPVGVWTLTPPVVPDGQYLWTRTVITYTDSTTSTSYSIGKMGTNGANGTPGTNGNTSYFHVAYATNDTGTVGFSTTDATGKTHIGTYTDFIQADSQNPTMYKWVLIKGLDGTQGPQGVPGPAGADGATRYTWIKYADSPTIGMSDIPTGKSYMGIAYNKTTATESSNYADYDWSLIKGADGTQGIPGPAGSATFTWVKYATSAAGTNMSDDPAGRTYIGLAYNKTTATESNVASDYQWALIKGADGNGINSSTVTYQLGTSGTLAPTGTWTASIPTVAAGQYLWTRTVIQFTDGASTTSYSVARFGADGAQGVPGPAGADGSPRYTWIKYADTPTTGMSDSPTGKIYMGIAYNKTTATESAVYTDYEWSLIKGADGIQGPAGSATYTWVKYATSAAGAGMSDDPAGMTYIGLAYNKSTMTESNVASDYQWALIKGVDGKGISTTLITYQAGASGTTAPTGTWTAAIPAVSPGQFLWTRTVVTLTDGTNTTSYSVSRQGQNGADGAAGVSVTSLTTYYQTVVTGAAAPAVPTAATPPAPWTTTEPAYVANRDLYSVTRITYSNTTFAYTSVIKVSAYTAATEAMIKALAADTTANGKNRIRTGSSTPVNDGTFKPDDLWYQTNVAGTEIIAVKVWNGSAWVTFKLTASSLLVPGSVGSILLENGAVTAEAVAATALDGKIITGATVRSAASGARTEMNASGLRVLDALGVELVKLGFGITTGMEVRNPATNTMFPLAQVAFGSVAASLANPLNTTYAPNTSYPYDAFASDTLTLTFKAPSSGGILSWGQTWVFNAGSFGTQSPVLYVQPSINNVPLTATTGGSNFPVFAQDSPRGANVGMLDDWICFPNSSASITTVPGTTYTIKLKWRLVTGAGSSSSCGLADRFISFQPTY